MRRRWRIGWLLAAIALLAVRLSATAASESSDVIAPLETATSTDSEALRAEDEGRIVFVKRTPKHTRDGLAAFLGVKRRGFRPSTNLYDRYAFDIFTIRPDGTDERQLTTDGMNDRPRWSWDGRWVAYVNGPAPVRNLYVVRADGSERRKLLARQQDILAYWWSYDSRQILVAVESRRGNRILEGRVIDIESGKDRRLGNSDWMRGWNHWEPGRDGVVNPRRRLLDALAGTDWPVWSPDAQFVAFIYDGYLALAHVPSVSNSGEWFLWRDEPPADGIFGWSWDGRRILFQLAGHAAIAELDKSRWGEVYLPTTRNVATATFNADGSRIAFASVPAGRRNAEIFVVDRTGDHETQITHSQVDHLNLQWQPLFGEGDESARP